MEQLKYTVIKSEEQYEEYCDTLEELVFSENTETKEDEIELLTLLIEDWDRKHPLGPELDPVELIKAFMDEHGLNQTELAEVVDYSKNYVSEILNYKKRIPPKMVRRFADYFKIQQSALNKTYRLEDEKTDDSNTKSSKIFSIKTGNQVKWDEDLENDESAYYPQTELEYGSVN
ncbi:helix-turn-helix domain-containing protein [Fodinibius salsisoli]|uniref:Helix-turn-helix domain-containing protein n=1 Tax=Fodinibius salsisoli TaxID=2820877 RepID=A0ABT3PTJ7_9BACT|nr:helix-turn-helix domain-containing protein [Fodinibius salsisoli]MCW9709207.1 helix-turn-helix domain-containing protein [Fodinibius salsisoli]